MRVSLAVALGFSVAGCQVPPEGPPPSTDGALLDGADSPDEPEFIPERVPDGSARENQAHIDYVLEAGLEDFRPNVEGLALVDLLVAQGYDRTLLELTPDMSLIQLPTESTALALRFGDECVIAQWSTDWYVSAIEPVVAGGRCLLGDTVSLD